MAPCHLDIKKPSSAGVYFLYFSFLGIFFFLFGIICCFFVHSAFTIGFILFILVIFLHPFASPEDYRGFICLFSSLSTIFYGFYYLDHKLKAFPEKEKKGKKKNKNLYHFFDPPVNTKNAPVRNFS